MNWTRTISVAVTVPILIWVLGIFDFYDWLYEGMPHGTKRLVGFIFVLMGILLAIVLAPIFHTVDRLTNKVNELERRMDD